MSRRTPAMNVCHSASSARALIVIRIDLDGPLIGLLRQLELALLADTDRPRHQ